MSSKKDKNGEGKKDKNKEDEKDTHNDNEGQSAVEADETEDEDKNMADISAAIAQQLKKVPPKSILKPSSSFETVEKEKAAARAKSTKWDEMNIIATLHPADKDYGFMKIDEPPTRFESPIEEDEPDEDGGINAQLLADKIRLGADTDPKSLTRRVSEESSGDEDETPEERAHRKEFEVKRKAHYNEFFAAKMARKMMDDDEDEDEEEEEEEDEDEEEANEGEDQTDGGKKKKNAKKKKTEASSSEGAGTSN
ncbi:protein phosphatase inhibitor 2 isoform X2 [Nilaparvata lugens]|uniref:protein phosphatase inhibitor 2 isoform X1 n=1 Tax=Nilaparvata lugens TaxID=108931 RepID=UPI00193DBFE5|nr:protein phosphatase inhibitor 2 isoform X1 [Nilaparvata lugens]XP_039286067.1 protein phosphatase inhibitor 2 isoform X2 [Nilaparvata lugens]